MATVVVMMPQTVTTTLVTVVVVVVVVAGIAAVSVPVIVLPSGQGRCFHLPGAFLSHRPGRGSNLRYSPGVVASKGQADAAAAGMVQQNVYR